MKGLIVPLLALILALLFCFKPAGWSSVAFVLFFVMLIWGKEL